MEVSAMGLELKYYQFKDCAVAFWFGVCTACVWGCRVGDCEG